MKIYSYHLNKARKLTPNKGEISEHILATHRPNP